LNAGTYILSTALLALAGTLSAAELPAKGTAGVMQLLRTECVGCHNPEKKKGGLILTSREAVLKGGDDGPIATPGKPDSSPLLKTLSKDADPHMPPKKQLSEKQIALLRDWVKAGLQWDAKAFEEDPFYGHPVVLEPLPSEYQPVLAMALSPDGTKLAFGQGGLLDVHEVGKTNYPPLIQMEANRDAIQSVAWTADGQSVLAGAFRKIVLTDSNTFKISRSFTNGLIGLITGIRSLPEDRIIFADSTPGLGGFVRVMEVRTGKITSSWKAHSDAIYAFDSSRDGSLLVTGSADRLIKIWEIETGKQLAQLEGHTAPVLGVSFNSNATQVVSCGVDKDIKIWDVQTHQKIGNLGKHAGELRTILWPGDGKTVYAAEEPGIVLNYKNLKAHSGMESSNNGDERKLTESADGVICIAVSPDAKRIFAGTQQGIVQVFNSEGKLLATVGQSTNQLKPLIALGSRKSATTASKSMATAASREKAILPVSFKSNSVLSLAAEPASIRLSSDAPHHGILVSAKLSSGFELDVTPQVKFSRSRNAPFNISPDGEIIAVKTGQGVLTAKLGKNEVEIRVEVESGTAADKTRDLPAAPTSFLRDVLPALSKAGCNAGACHAKADGQNGFKLSVFSYDPKADYAKIVRDAHGRRIFPAAPEESLLLLKPTTRLPHEGGLRFETGSETEQLLVRWIREGLAYSLPNEPTLERLTILPKERRYRKNATQRVLVEAHYSDGSVRDVTRLAAFDSNDKEIAKVDDQGTITVGTLAGQGVIVGRYMGLVADAHIIVPADRLLPDEKYAALPRNNFIDQLAYDHFRQLGLFPSELCSDAEFLRRASLDAIGILPTPDEVRKFLDDTDADKRKKLIARLLDHPAYSDFWANKWADLLRPNPDRVGVKSVFILDQWIRESFRQDKSYDQFVRDIILAEGSNHREGPAVVYRDRREPSELTTMFSQLFLGTRLECAKCHHHPNEKWSQDDFYQFAAFFGTVKQKGAGLSPPISGGSETFFFAPGGKVKHPVGGQVMSPRALDAAPVQNSEKEDPRNALADWLTSSENPFFAKAAVNRVWGSLFGRGLVEPVDDFRVSNPCVDPPLLAALANDFAKDGFHLKHLIRTIMESRLYQLSSTPNEYNLADTRNFSRAYRRRLPAEVLLDAVNQLTGIPDNFAGMPPGARAMQMWSYKIESNFLDAFSRPNPSSDCPCERDRQMSVVQSLHLMNSKGLQGKLSNPEGRVHQLAESNKAPEAIATELYLAALNRPPKEEEVQLSARAFAAKGATRQTATEDLLWALINSAEFVFNH
jgi:WD40 repeat protein/mono/diheme cytochrome c family protein